MKLEAHIARIARRGRVRVNYTYGSPFAWAGAREVYIPPVKTHVSYAIALHELGHVFSGGTTRYNRELRAWNWARQNALVWSSGMEALRQLSLRLWREWRVKNCC